MAHSVISSVAKWKEFLTRYCKQDLQLLAVSDARNKALIVEYPKLPKFDVLLSEELVKNPDLCLAHAEDAITLVDLPVKVQLTARVRIVKIPQNLRIRDIQTQHIHTLVSIRCMVRNISKTDRRRITEAAFECARCKNVIYIPQEGSGKFIEPSYCQCNEKKKGVFRLLFQESRFEEFQRIRIQELTEDLEGGGDPLPLDANLTNDLTQQVTPGEKITVVGILRSSQRIKNQQKTAYFDDYLDVISIERSERCYEDIKATPAEEEEIRKIAQGPDPLGDIVASIAPAITGMDDPKEGVAHILFSGIRKQLPDGTHIRGDSHCLFAGDAGTGKSLILEHVSILAPRVMVTSGESASGAGLTAATVQDDWGEGFTLEAGAMVLADQGVCIVDEIDKMKIEERKKMYRGMEQQEIRIDRAGIHAVMRCQCSIIAAGNPKKGKWDSYDSIPDQLNMDAALISRFALIYIIQDKPEVKRDTTISGQILAAHHTGQRVARQKFKPNRASSGTVDLEISKSITPRIPDKLLRKYVALGRQCYPELTDDAKEVLQEYYLKLRKAGDGENNPMSATARNMDDLVRLSEAAARMRLSEDWIEKRDAEQAVRVHYNSLKNSAIDPDSGKVDITLLTVGIGKAQRDRFKAIHQAISRISKNNGGRCNLESLEELLKTEKYTVERLGKDLDKMRVIGEIFYPEDGCIASSSKQ